MSEDDERSGSPPGYVLGPAFYGRNTVTVARELIGTLLIRAFPERVVTTRIVETEAYRHDDPASHSYRGPTERCRVMFGPPGRAYVYRSYGIHHCLNVVTEEEGSGCAVLIRAVEPIDSWEILWRRRFGEEPWEERKRVSLTNGPGKLTQALDITLSVFNGHDLREPPLYLTPGEVPGTERPESERIEHDLRIGIRQGRDLPWRFYDADSRFVSRRPVQPKRPPRHR